MSKIKKIFVIGHSDTYRLERSFVRAADEFGIETIIFDPFKENLKYIKVSIFGRMIHDFWPVEAWTKKMNRELIIEARRFEPDLILIFGMSEVLAGTLATLKVMLKKPIFWYWPDSPLNLTSTWMQNSALIDQAFIYYRAAVPIFKKLGFKASYLPFAGDKFLHGRKPNTSFKYDLSFVGNYRPEREKALIKIIETFPGLKIQIFGPEWAKKIKNKMVGNYLKESRYGQAAAEIYNQSRININVIDETNYPGANMRFYEIPMAGGLQLCSDCPELEKEFIDGQTIFYFKSERELISKIRYILKNPQEASAIRQRGFELINLKHSYNERMRTIVEAASDMG